mgnify:FL=1
MDWVVDELDQFDKRDGDRFYITEENKQVLRDIAPFWEHNTVKERGLTAMPEKSRVFYDLGIIKAEGNITSGDAHIAVDYERVLKNGLKEYVQRTHEKLENLDMTEWTNLNKSYFYRSILIVMEAVQAFAKRYADMAFHMAQDETSEKRKKELLEISRFLNRVPY